MKLLLSISLFCATTICESQNILIIGNGGREHAIAQKTIESSRVHTVYVAPGNGGTAKMNRVYNVPINPTDINALLHFAQEKAINLTIVGPELPLANGIVDVFSAAGLRCFGPSRAAAQIETSKQFAKDFMYRHGIPTAAYISVSSLQEAESYIEKATVPIVVKADGLAAGKGVVIAQSRQEARDTVAHMLSGDAFGDAGKTVVLEQFLEGHEVSFFALCDGHNVIPFTTAQDYKRVGDGDTGPNTGGMGAYSPAPCITPELHDRIMQKIIKPTIENMAAEGMPFVGFLYAGLMISPEGNPYVIEFNCRLGDPETQTILPRLKTDLVALCAAALDKKLDTLSLEWDARSAVTVVIADSGYPHSLHLGQKITCNPFSDALLFHAATAWKNEQLMSTGGRILAITSLADSFDRARKNVYEAVQTVHLPHIHYRKDIAQHIYQ